ncbi:MAG: type II secretion system protein GspG, partial [Verrucomicrobiota bacterium]
KAAFTLIELMVTITIIIILAGLVVGGMEYANQRSASEKAKTQIALLSKGIEEYKLDMGGYPPTNNITGNLTTAGSSTSAIIFNALYFAPLSANQRIYLPELDPATTKQGWTTGASSNTTIITDPWGNQFCYRSAINSSGATNTATVNSDFDLWSMGKDGKTNASSANATVSPNADDIRNF